MGRFIVVVLDSFGVGAMDDVPEIRPQDVGANTCKHILESQTGLYLPNLQRLGLMNALGEEIGNMTFSPDAVFGTANLLHFGGDTFYGHQEIMGTYPQKPLIQPFSEVIDSVAKALQDEGYEVSYIGDQAKLLVVNNCATVGDNLETDSGQVYNVSGCLDLMPFAEIRNIGETVRKVVKVSRVIAFGGENVSMEQLLRARKEKNGMYAGIDAPESGIYNKGYQVVHLGYGMDPNVQVPTILGKQGVDVSLIGKVADIVENHYGKSIYGVDTHFLFGQTLAEMKRISHGFICLNIQETDLAGHAQDVERYADRLHVSDGFIGQMMEELNHEDILIVMADHGNDPTIGHSNHTREKVPILVYRKNVGGRYLGCFDTMSNVGATAVAYFGAESTENGRSFLKDIKG
jgi:phosphopentomutase